MEAFIKIKDYFIRVLICIDQLINVLLGGKWCDETMSSALYRLQDQNWFYRTFYYIVNFIFFWQDNHCKESYESEIERNHLKEDMR